MTEPDLLPPDGMGTGYVARNWDEQPEGAIPFTRAFDLDPIPEDEWKDRVDYLMREEADLLHLAQREGVEASDQNGYGYCWAHGCVNALRVIRAKEGQPYADLSATAVAATIKNYRNRGGNTFEAIPFMAERGVPTTEFWPQNEVNRRHDTPQTWENAKLHVMTEWYELGRNDFNQMATCLLNLIPVACGFVHWGHLVCACRLQYRERGRSLEWGIRGYNSWKKTWGPYGDGTFELWGRKAVSFDQAAPCVARAA